MHCPNCGQQTDSKLKFCRSCGMKLDSVARALDEHLTVEVEESYPATDLVAEKKSEEKVEKKSERPSGSRFFSRIFIGIVMIFIGVVIGVAGEGIWGAKTAAVIVSLLGMLIAAFGFIPVAARYDRELLRSIGTAGKGTGEGAGEGPGKKEIPGPERKAGLPGGDDFEPATKATPAASVTEGTTRNLDEEKIKVSR